MGGVVPLQALIFLTIWSPEILRVFYKDKLLTYYCLCVRNIIIESEIYPFLENIITHKDTICMDEFGHITHNGIIKIDNNKKMYKYVKSLIKKHIKESQIREGDILPEPLRER